MGSVVLPRHALVVQPQLFSVALVAENDPTQGLALRDSPIYGVRENVDESAPGDHDAVMLMFSHEKSGQFDAPRR